jgi:DNA-binding NarL/FixJ family response regulator
MPYTSLSQDFTTEEPHRPLTDREWEVARLVGKGLCYKDIGKELKISHHTARAHVRTIAGVLPWSEPRVSPLRHVMVWVIAHERLAARVNR